ncbi:MAG: ribonuclease HII [Hyphomicrobiales bacterium]|nr:ribonuclease HII [Hyphomicrobiales bacterium]
MSHEPRKIPSKIEYAPDYSLEESLGAPRMRIAGIDEAGRGAWAGPVVAAAVILARDNIPEGIRDSKLLRKPQREELFERITRNAVCAVGTIDSEEIDRINILQASLKAMAAAVAKLPEPPQAILVDGKQTPSLPEPLSGIPARAVVKGDRKSLSIAAASIIAKVTRDRLMTELSKNGHAYGWERNAGYGTRTHRDALDRFGVSKQHRRSFAPIHKILSQ